MEVTRKISILVLGDTHVRYSNKHLLTQAIKHIEELPTYDYVIHLGDFWDRSNGLQFEDLDLAAALLQVLSTKARERFYLIKGNHDIRKGSVHGLKLISFHPKVTLVETPTTITLGRLQVAFLPYGTPRELKLEANIAFGHLPLKGFKLSTHTRKVQKTGFDAATIRERFHLYFGGHHHIYEEKRSLVVVGSFLPTRKGEPLTCRYVEIEMEGLDVFWTSKKVSYEVEEEGSSREEHSMEVVSTEDVFERLKSTRMIVPSELQNVLLESIEDDCVRSLAQEVCTEIGSWD